MTEQQEAMIVGLRAEAYHRLKKLLRVEGGYDADLDGTLAAQWWTDVLPFFGYGGWVWWVEDPFYIERRTITKKIR